MYYPKKFFNFLFAFVSFAVLFSATATYSQMGPILTQPANGNTCQPLNVKFAWNPSDGAISYTVEISVSSTFSQYQSYDVGSSTTFSQLFTDYNKQFFWRVRALFPGTSVLSAVWNFTTKKAPPVKDLPSHQDECVTKQVEFYWHPVTDATRYILQVSESSTFGQLLVNATVNSITYTTTMPENNKEYFWRVSASLTECETEWSPAWSYKTKPPQPQKLSPENSATGIKLSPTLWWNRPQGVSGSTQITYNFQLASNQAFSNPIYDHPNLTSNTFSTGATQLLYNTTYYWRVGATIPFCSIEWSDFYTFKTLYVSPILNLPANNAICIVLSPMITWSASAGATAYRVQVSTTADFSETLYDALNVTGTSFQLSDLEPLKSYYWRVKADDNNNESDWSETYKFTTTVGNPEPLFPQDNATGVGVEIDFSWTVPAPNSHYRFQLSNSTDFDQPLENVAGLTSPEFRITGLNYNTTYYWRLSASFTTCTSAWSPVFSFTTTLASPALVMPSNKEERVSLSQIFVWQPVPGADRYDIDIATDSKFQSIFTGRRGVPSNSIQISGFEPTTKLFWRVRALNDVAVSEWSEYYEFTTTMQGAGIPILTEPQSGSVKQPVSGVLTWEVSPRAVSYHIQISEKNDFSQVIATESGLTETNFEYENFEHFKTYFWRVRALNDSGYTAWSAVWNFRITALAPNQIIQLWTPVNNLKDAPTHIYFSWYPIDRIDGYHLQIATDNSFSQQSMFFDDDRVWKSPKNIYELEENTTYYWRVRGWNEAGNSPWSEIWTFKTEDLSSVSSDNSFFKTNVFPNPFSEKVRISFMLDKPMPVSIKILDVSGREVANLSSGELTAGANSVEWNAAGLSPGLYLYTISSGKNTETGRLVLIK